MMEGEVRDGKQRIGWCCAIMDKSDQCYFKWISTSCVTNKNFGEQIIFAEVGQQTQQNTLNFALLVSGINCKKFRKADSDGITPPFHQKPSSLALSEESVNRNVEYEKRCLYKDFATE